MSEVWESIERKLRGHNEAAMNLGQPCSVCSQWLIPYDTGVDPELNKRYWVTECCGIRNRYEEKLNEVNLQEFVGE